MRVPYRLRMLSDRLISQLEKDPNAGEPESPTSRKSGEERQRQKLADLESRKDREITLLNQEVSRSPDPISPAKRETPRNNESTLVTQVSELESLVESKIFREDELENTLAKYREMLAKANVPGFAKDAEPSSSTPARRAHGSNDSAGSAGNGEAEACELCGDKGHDLLHCPLMNTDESNQAWCDNCEKCVSFFT